MNKEKKIPTILGLILLVASIFGGLYLTSHPVRFGSKASGDCQPVNINISNITHQSFSFSFSTSGECLASLSLDSQTVTDQNGKSKLHYFQIDNLKEDTNYRFSAISGGNTYTSDSYQIKTAKKPKSPLPTSNLAWGKVFDANNNPAIGSLVFISFGENTPLSARVTTKGYWSISLVNSFNSAKDDWATPPPDTPEEIIVFGIDGSVTTLEGNTSRNNPVPDIILGQNEFVQTSLDSQTGSLDPGQEQTVVEKSLTITNPQEGESVMVPRPAFFGTAPLGSDLTIKLESPVVITDQVKANTDGSWNWSPPQNLTPGEHTITVTAADPQTGLLSAVSRKFTVYATDVGGPGFVASVSASIITPTPTYEPTPTLIPTRSPTSTPAPTLRSAKPTSSGELIESGTSTPTILLILMSTVMAVLGYLFLRKSPN